MTGSFSLVIFNQKKPQYSGGFLTISGRKRQYGLGVLGSQDKTGTRFESDSRGREANNAGISFKSDRSTLSLSRLSRLNWTFTC